MTLKEVIDNCGQVRIKGARKTVDKAYWFMLEDYQVVDSRRLRDGRCEYTVVPDWVIRARRTNASSNN